MKSLCGETTPSPLHSLSTPTPQLLFSDSILKIPSLLQNIPSVLTLDPVDQCLPGADGPQGGGIAQLPGCLDLCWNTQDESEHLCSFGHSSAHLLILSQAERVWGGGSGGVGAFCFPELLLADLTGLMSGKHSSISVSVLE